MKINKSFWLEGYGSFLLAIGIALLVRWAFIEPYVIPSGSMMPTLLVHDHIFVNKLVYGIRVPFTEKWLAQWKDPERGEVIVFKYPEDETEYYIKRVVGLPGDRVFYEKGDLYIDEELVSRTEPGDLASHFDRVSDSDFPEYLEGKAGVTHWRENLGDRSHSVLLAKQTVTGEGVSLPSGPFKVPEDHYFVMGDNRDNSQDSRAWPQGYRFVPRENVVGRAMFVWLSCSKTLETVPFLCDPRHLRWSRFFDSIQN